MFKPYEMNFGFTIDDVNYEFEHVDSFNVENNQRVRLTRGANAFDKVGLAFREGTKEANVITMTLVGIPTALFDVLMNAYDNEKRMSVWGTVRATGAMKIGNNAVLSQKPEQLTIDESAESLSIALMFECFDVKEVRK